MTQELIEEIPDLPPVKTWDDVRKQRDSMLFEAESMYNFDSPESLKQAWKDFKQKLRDLPETYKDLEDLNQIEWPEFPSDYIQQLRPTR